MKYEQLNITVICVQNVAIFFFFNVYQLLITQRR